MDIDREIRNYYNYGDFGHLARNCRNRETRGRIGQGRKLEYRNEYNKQSNLNRE